ncbi:MAG: putative RNA uridine N3 methyltransferase [Candidatus Nitrosocosmicus sp.]
MIILSTIKLKFDLAIPDSFLHGVLSEIDRTFKIFQLSRALSIFRVENIFIFHDKIINPKNDEIDFIITILEYLDTPQYLRKKIYSKLDSLKYVGKLHPIRSPHHKDKISLENIKHGETRVGILEKKDKLFFVDVGLDSLIKYQGKIKQQGTKINVKLLKNNNFLTAIDVNREEINEIYWGYKVFYFNSLQEILKKYHQSKIVLTSRYSDYFKNDSPFSNNLKNNSSTDNSILIVFGSPKFGLNEIFIKEKINISNYHSFNFFPYQGTQTVRLEESIFGILSIMNNFVYS